MRKNCTLLQYVLYMISANSIRALKVSCVCISAET